jgi:hypothetical protein
VQNPQPPPPPGPPPPSPSSYLPAPEQSVYRPIVAPTDGGAVWAFVLGILSWFTCPLVGIVAFFVGGSALGRIRTNQGALRGDGLAHAGQALGCLANVIWLVLGVLVFGACSLGALSTLPFIHPSPAP